MCSWNPLLYITLDIDTQKHNGLCCAWVTKVEWWTVHMMQPWLRWWTWHHYLCKSNSRSHKSLWKMETGSHRWKLVLRLHPFWALSDPGMNRAPKSWSVTRQYVVSGATECTGMQHSMFNRHWWIMLKDGLTTLYSNAVNYLLCSHSASSIIHEHVVTSPLVHCCCDYSTNSTIHYGFHIPLC